MAGTAIRIIFCNPQHGWDKESTSSEIFGDTPEMSGSHQHGAEEKIRMAIMLIGLVVLTMP